MGPNVRTTVPQSKQNRTPVRQRALDVFAATAAAFRKDLTAAERLSWKTGDNAVVNRSRTAVTTTAMRRYMQVQMPIAYAGLVASDTNDQLRPYTVENLVLLNAFASTQSIEFHCRIKRQDASPHRSVMHMSQVPTEYVGKPYTWKQALWSESVEFFTALLPPFGKDAVYPFAAKFPFVAGDTVGGFARITHFDNANPPVTPTDSTESTEDWTLFTVVAVA